MKLLRNTVLALTLLFPGLAAGEETKSEAPELSLELNAADLVGETCRLTFLLHNNLEVDVEQFTVETVFFSDKGQVVLLTLFDFGALPIGRPRVRQFQIPNVSCSGLSMVLVNGTDTCAGEGLSPAICERSMSVSSRTDIALEG